MDSVGVELKSAREKKNISLVQISEDTHISVRHLENLEQGRYAQLPGGLYNRAFLRAYCEYVGLDSSRALEMYEAQVHSCPAASAPRKTPFVQPGLTERRVPPLLAWSLMLIVSIGSLLYTRHWITQSLSPYFPRTPLAVRWINVRPLVLPFAQQSSTLTPAAAAERAKVPQAMPVVSSDEGTSSATPPAHPVGSIRLEFEVVETSWISLNIDGTWVVKLLKPGDDQSFEAFRRLDLVLGNPDGVRLKINGRPLQLPMANMSITAESLNALLERAASQDAKK